PAPLPSPRFVKRSRPWLHVAVTPTPHPGRGREVRHPRPCGVGGGRDFVAGAQRAARVRPPRRLRIVRPSGKSEPAAPSHTVPGQRAKIAKAQPCSMAGLAPYRRGSTGDLDTSAIVANFTPVSATRQRFLFIWRVRLMTACSRQRNTVRRL